MAETATQQRLNRFLTRLSKSNDLFVAIGTILVVMMLIIPLPPFLLDLTLLINLTLGLLIILATIYIEKPVDFSAFPTLILLTTVFGLALNVSSTRLILTEGEAGNIIAAFGNFVVRGNLTVGLVIFIVLLAIQFLVITKGATRVSEVAARFALDSLPGKQLSINEDLNAGLIDDKEARRRREELNTEANFYGAMDGSSKFVSGNVKVAIVVLLVDIIGGLVIGMGVRGESLSDAARRYTMLTIGDGLVSQIPALLISTATGIIVTRNSATKEFSNDIIRQLTLLPKVLFIAGGTILLMALLPGFPVALNLFVGALLIAVGWVTQRQIQTQNLQKEAVSRAEVSSKESTTTIEDIVRIDPMSLEIGYNLIPLVDKQQMGDLLERIKLMRQHIGLSIGVLVPPIRIVDNVGLDSTQYLIKIRGVNVAGGSVRVNRLLAMNPKEDIASIEGIEVNEPTFGLPAKWILTEHRQLAESRGFDVFDPTSVIATHLTEVIKRNACDLLTRQDVNDMLDALKKDYNTIVEEVLKQSNISDIQKVLQNLLREHVKIRNMVPILETIADFAPTTRNPDLITEYVRQSLSKQIILDYANEQKNIQGIIVDPNLEAIMAASIEDTPQGFVSTLDPQIVQSFVDQAGQVLEQALSTQLQPVVLCSQKVRRLVHEILYRPFPLIGVLSYSEIPNDYTLTRIALISLPQNSPQATRSPQTATATT